MLWHKCWLETRFLAFFMVVFAIFPIALATLNIRSADAPQRSPAAVERNVGFLVFYYSMIPLALAGSGVKTQAGPQTRHNLYGSTYFTLSLPVSRFRLLGTRAGLGMLESVGISAIAPCAVWITLPSLRSSISGSDLLLFWVTLSVCTSAIYFLGVLISTVLEDPWRGLASLVGLLFLRWLLPTLPLPPSFDIFRAMGVSSPLFTHTLPWASMGISIGAAAILFYAALRVVQKLEY